MSNTCPCLSKMTQHVAHATLVGASMLGIICMNERREIQHMTWSSSPGKLIAKKKKATHHLHNERQRQPFKQSLVPFRGYEKQGQYSDSNKENTSTSTSTKSR